MSDVVVAMFGGVLLGAMIAPGDQFWIGLVGAILCIGALVSAAIDSRR